MRLGDKGDQPNPEPPSPARVSAAVARLSRRHARACDHLASVFGEGSAAVVALARRVDALYAAGRFDQPERASRLRDLAMWLDAAAESIEAENNDAAEVHVLLDGIVRECEFIESAASVAA